VTLETSVRRAKYRLRLRWRSLNLQGQLLQSKGNLAAAQANLNKVIAGNRSPDIAGATANLNKVRATEALVQVGLSDSRSVSAKRRRCQREASRSEKRLRQRIQNRPNQLSGGQQQRVAIAALVNHPALVLTDEPTGALDSTTSEEIMNLLTELNQQGTTIAIVTHDANVAARTKRIIRMVDGVIIKLKNFL